MIKDCLCGMIKNDITPRYKVNFFYQLYEEQGYERPFIEQRILISHSRVAEMTYFDFACALCRFSCATKLDKT